MNSLNHEKIESNGYINQIPDIQSNTGYSSIINSPSQSSPIQVQTIDGYDEIILSPRITPHILDKNNKNIPNISLSTASSNVQIFKNSYNLPNNNNNSLQQPLSDFISNPLLNSGLVVGSYQSILVDNINIVKTNIPTSTDEMIIDKSVEKNELSIKEIRDKVYAEKRLQKSSGRDWNKDFQGLLRLSASLSKFQSLSYLAMDFVKAAEMYGLIIIKEMFMPIELKTIKPINIGGIAGGEKYICQNILFKFAYDQQISEGIWLYGGNYPSEVGASKQAGNELKSLSTFFQHTVDNQLADLINLPLMCIIDYYGYRVTAMSLLPINKTTLVYGSSDGGSTVRQDRVEINEAMERLGRSMNLQAHFVGQSTPKLVYGPGDLEVHLDENNSSQYYAIDFGRLFPPEAYFKDGKAIAHRDVFFKLLRPEFFKNYDKALSSDAFTAWSNNDPDSDIWNQNLSEATLHLYNVIIPRAAVEFNSQWDSRQLDRERWDTELETHKYGINLRHLGRLRHLIDNSDLRKLILNEMVARVLKNKIKEDLRINMAGNYIGSEESAINSVTEFLNMIFGVDKFENSKYFWTITIKSWISEKFGDSPQQNGLTEREFQSEFDLMTIVNLQEIIKQFQEKAGITLSESVLEQLKKFGNGESKRLPFLLYSDIKQIRPLVKHSNSIARSEGISLYMKATEMIYANQIFFEKPLPKPNYLRFGSDFHEEIRLLQACNEKLNIASRSSTTDASLYHLLGLVDFELYKLTQKSSLLNSSRDKLLISIKYQATPTCLISLATIYDVMGHHKESIKLYDRLTSTYSAEQYFAVLFESAYIYSPNYTLFPGYGLNGASFHQFYIIIKLLVSLNNREHPLVQKYLYNSYKLFLELLIKTCQFQNQDIHNPIKEILELRNQREYQFNEISMLYGQFIDSGLEYDAHILDNVLRRSLENDIYYITIRGILKCSVGSRRLSLLVKEAFESGQINLESMSSEKLEELFSNSEAFIQLFTVHHIQLKTVIAKSAWKGVDICQFNACINLQLSAFYFNAETINNLVYLSSRLQKLTLKEITFAQSDFQDDKPKLSKFDFKSLLELNIIDSPMTFNLLESIMLSCKLSLKKFYIDRSYLLDREDNDVNCPMSHCITSLQSIESLQYTNISAPLDYLSLPLTLKSLALNRDLSDNSVISEMVKKGYPLKTIYIENISNLHSLLEPLKNIDIQSLTVHCYYNYFQCNNLLDGLDLHWSRSLTHLKLLVGKEFSGYCQFFSSLKALTTLYLDTSSGSEVAFNDHLINEFLPNLINLNSFTLESTNYKLIETANFYSSIQYLSLYNCGGSQDNWKNLGKIYPNLRELRLQNPRALTDYAMRSTISTLPVTLENIRIIDAYDLSDLSFIDLANSSIAQNLKSLILLNVRLSDSIFIKMVESCPNLLFLTPSFEFKSKITHKYIKAKYPHIHLSFKPDN
ncbi:hypothetical protein DLAC_03928 [Tieghemostelium lacteum]|uniref:Clu domain-containing protein n=1 Tax=Tieghemostelium lacteum TaxID=361077 RepID=A0A151ZRT8_TIELA|nr:hypothetical protein DLAC_03928 [Tieghemostelium lacteum]|eukprot:KYQ96645.1 hypothetical protein DLAC_03928 [Tieghemostelium lacteum]